jgi:hypothetical protein
MISDVIHHLCTALSNDLGTLYNLALSSRLYSSVALPTLYLKLVKFPSDDDEDRLEEDATSYANRLTKWSSLWKSLALSALDPTSTMTNYAAYLRVLNLRDLLSFMEEFRSPRAQRIRAEFFAEKGLQNCNKTYKSFGGQIRYDVNESADSLTDIITSGTRNVTTLIRQTSEQPFPDKALHFCRWLTFMPALESLQLFLAEVFEDERARHAVVNCPNLKSLEIYLWTLNLPLPPTDPDTSLAQLLSTIAGRGLEILIIKHGSTSFGHLSLSALSRYHGKSLKELEILDISDGCLASFGMAQITNLRSCILSYSGLVIPSTTCNAISQFLARNTSLERLELRLAGLQDIFPTAIPSLRLKYLCLYPLFNDVLLDPLWNAISTQSDSLETLILRGVSQDPDSPCNIDTMLNAIRQLHKLKVLTITTSGVVVTDGDINQIVSNCRNLEEITLPGRLSDESLRSLSTLPRLTTFISQFFLSLIPLNIDCGIRSLIWVFSSLLTLRQR